MVFIHELGHFVAAKINGVAVETFSLGWGPRLVGFRWRGTTYQISWLPIGGYCKMKGELVPGIAGGRGADQPAAPEKGSFLAAALPGDGSSLQCLDRCSTSSLRSSPSR